MSSFLLYLWSLIIDGFLQFLAIGTEVELEILILPFMLVQVMWLKNKLYFNKVLGSI